MDNSDVFQIPTLIVIGIIVIVCLFFAMIFANPQVALNPFKPILPSPTVIALVFPPTNTPVPTDTPTLTLTPTSTLTPSSTPTLANTPTNTTVPIVLTATRTRTVRPLPRPTVIISAYAYNARYQGCFHAGQTFIEGTVYRTAAGDREQGTRVALGSGPGPGTGDIYYVTSSETGYYVHMINAAGPTAGTFFVWIADASNRAISDPNAGRVQTNTIRNPDDPGACWRGVVDFVRK